MLGYFDFRARTSGVVAELNVSGGYLRYQSGAAGGADTRILVRANTGLIVVLKPGQAVRMPEGINAIRWTIENYAKAADISGVVVIGMGSVDDSTITGEVSVIDGALSRTLANQVYMKAIGVGAVAAQYAHAQLYNPVGSGKNLYLETASFSSTTGQAILAGDYAASLALLAGAVMNKYLGNAAGAGVIRYANNAAQLFTASGFQLYLAANSPGRIELREPVVVPPGRGFVVVCNTVNTDLSANFEWYEQAI